jgi:hypothetical protein
MQSESIEELEANLNGMVQTLESEEMNSDGYREFISHKYMVLVTHAHIEGAKIDSYTGNSSEKLKSQKIRNIYSQIEETLSSKAHELTTEQMLTKIKLCQALVTGHVQ